MRLAAFGGLPSLSTHGARPSSVRRRHIWWQPEAVLSSAHREGRRPIRCVPGRACHSGTRPTLDEEDAEVMNNIARLRNGLSAERKRKIAARTATIIAEERSLQELRRAHKLTQKKMPEVLGIGQDSVSRLEQRSDLLISTLRGYVEAMGGKLSLVAEFPDQEPVILTGLASLD